MWRNGALAPGGHGQSTGDTPARAGCSAFGDEPAAHRGAVAVQLDPQGADARYNLGMISVDRGETEAAIAHLQRAAALDSDVALYHYNLAVATFMAGRPAEALPHIQNAIRLDLDDPDARGFRKVVRRELDATAGARDADARVRQIGANP